VHTVADGDVVIAASSGDKSQDANLVGIIAAELTEKAIIRAVEVSESLGGIPSFSDIKSGKFS